MNSLFCQGHVVLKAKQTLSFSLKGILTQSDGNTCLFNLTPWNLQESTFHNYIKKNRAKIGSKNQN